MVNESHWKYFKSFYDIFQDGGCKIKHTCNHKFVIYYEKIAMQCFMGLNCFVICVHILKLQSYM